MAILSCFISLSSITSSTRLRDGEGVAPGTSNLCTSPEIHGGGWSDKMAAGSLSPLRRARDRPGRNERGFDGRDTNQVGSSAQSSIARYIEVTHERPRRLVSTKAAGLNPRRASLDIV